MGVGNYREKDKWNIIIMELFTEEIFCERCNEDTEHEIHKKYKTHYDCLKYSICLECGYITEYIEDEDFINSYEDEKVLCENTSCEKQISRSKYEKNLGYCNKCLKLLFPFYGNEKDFNKLDDKYFKIN